MPKSDAVTQMEDFLKHTRPEVAKELTIVTPEDLGTDTLFHIAFAKQAKMGPFISKRAGINEDNTVPRIHVAPTIQGCILGYGGLYEIAAFDYVLHKDDKQQTGKMGKLQNYKGGFYIHALKFEAALAPSAKLVYDAKRSGELWLVTYTPETVFYKSPVVGKLIPISVEFFPQTGDVPSALLKVAIEISADVEVPLGKLGENVSKGYWEAYYESSENKCKHIRTTAISKEQFFIHKGTSAVLLSAAPTPVWGKW